MVGRLSVHIPNDSHLAGPLQCWNTGASMLVLWQRILGGSWVVISGVISPLVWVISIVTLLINPLITTHEPPGIQCDKPQARNPKIPNSDPGGGFGFSVVSLRVHVPIWYVHWP